MNTDYRPLMSLTLSKINAAVSQSFEAMTASKLSGQLTLTLTAGMISTRLPTDQEKIIVFKAGAQVTSDGRSPTQRFSEFFGPRPDLQLSSLQRSSIFFLWQNYRALDS
jgi:hypothetical protein